MAYRISSSVHQHTFRDVRVIGLFTFGIETDVFCLTLNPFPSVHFVLESTCLLFLKFFILFLKNNSLNARKSLRGGHPDDTENGQSSLSMGRIRPRTETETGAMNMNKVSIIRDFISL